MLGEIFTCSSKGLLYLHVNQKHIKNKEAHAVNWTAKGPYFFDELDGSPRGLYLDSIFSELITKTEGCQSRRRHVHQLKTFAIFSYRTQKEIINCLLSGSLSGRVRIP